MSDPNKPPADDATSIDSWDQQQFPDSPEANTPKPEQPEQPKENWLAKDIDNLVGGILEGPTTWGDHDDA